MTMLPIVCYNRFITVKITRDNIGAPVTVESKWHVTLDNMKEMSEFMHVFFANEGVQMPIPEFVARSGIDPCLTISQYLCATVGNKVGWMDAYEILHANEPSEEVKKVKNLVQSIENVVRLICDNYSSEDLLQDQILHLNDHLFDFDEDMSSTFPMIDPKFTLEQYDMSDDEENILQEAENTYDSEHERELELDLVTPGTTCNLQSASGSNKRKTTTDEGPVLSRAQRLKLDESVKRLLDTVLQDIQALYKVGDGSDHFKAKVQEYLTKTHDPNAWFVNPVKHLLRIDNSTHLHMDPISFSLNMERLKEDIFRGAQEFIGGHTMEFHAALTDGLPFEDM